MKLALRTKEQIHTTQFCQPQQCNQSIVFIEWLQKPCAVVGTTEDTYFDLDM